MCADNLKALLNPFKDRRSDVGDVFVKVLHATIINKRFEGGNNYLHILVNRLMQGNQVDVCEMIQELVTYKCNSNLENDHLESPYELFVKKAKELNLDLESLKVMWGVENGDAGGRKHLKKDFNFMMQFVKEFDEKKFIAEYKNFIAQSQNEPSDSSILTSRLLEAAVVRNLIDVVNFLVANGANVNETSDIGEFQLPPAFLACVFGYHRVLNVLLSDVSLKFSCEKTKQNLLHVVCSSIEVQAEDRQKCFEQVTRDQRCTRKIINGIDSAGHPSLFYACRNGFDEFAKELLRHGAYIGHKSIIGMIDKNVLKEFLDESVKTSSQVGGKDCEIHIDYRFLIDHEKNNSEIRPAQLMSHSKLKDLIGHPVISSFLFLKWKRVDFIIYSKLLIYFCFMIFLGSFIVIHFKDDVYLRKHAANPETSSSGTTTDSTGNLGDDAGYQEPDSPVNEVREIPNILELMFGVYRSKPSDPSRRKRSIGNQTKDVFMEEYQKFFNEHKVSYTFCFMGVCMMILYEIVQCALSYKRYFFKFSNWLDLILLTLAITVLLSPFYILPVSHMRVRSVTILVIAAQTIELISKISFLSMSLHMAIFKRVCVTFLKTLSLYLILILAFAMSFYTLDEDKPLTMDTQNEGKDKSFSSPFMSFITALRMMLSDFDTVRLKEDDQFKGAIFLLFIIFITIVLFNLLTALAISDTRKILKSAELVDAQKRISILCGVEKILSFFDLSFAKLFPEMSSIMFKLNDDHIVHVENKVNQTENKAIFVKNAGKVRESINFYATQVTFWKRPQIQVKLSTQTVEKLVAIARTQRELIFHEY